MSWNIYIDNLMANWGMADAAIYGYLPGNVSCWAAYTSGWFSGIEENEIQRIIATDRSGLFCNGLTLAGHKCTVLRDNLNMEGQNTMDLKMKISDTNADPVSITIGKANQCLIFGRGIKDAPGGKINPPIYEMTSYLKKMNY